MLLTIEETKKLIENGKTLYLAGEEALLKSLPKGNWIGGTIPYFMDTDGGVSTKERIFVTEQPAYIDEFIINSYDSNNLENIVRESPDNGFSIVIIPASSDVHIRSTEARG